MGRFLIRFLYAGLILWLALIVISNMGLFQPNWPFELFASFMRQALILSLIGLIGLSFRRLWGQVAALLLVSCFAFWPLFNSENYVDANSEVCESKNCITAIFANLRREPSAFKAIRRMSRSNDADIIALSEVPPQMTREKLAEYLSEYPHIVFSEKSLDGRKLGSLMAIASKLPIRSQRLIVEDYPHYPRSLVVVEIDDQYRGFDFILTHPRMPLSHAGMRRRDEVLSMLTSLVIEKERFVIAGDFNMTPWAPAFDQLPGRRAGNARLESTWKDGWSLLGLPIDHFLIGNQISLGKAEVLGPSRSDHRPILISFYVVSN